MVRTISRDEGAMEPAEAPMIVAAPVDEIEEARRLNEETRRLLDEIRALRTSTTLAPEPVGMVGTGLENVPLPSDRDEFPKRYYHPKYLFLEIFRPDSAYPIRFVNGEFVAKNEYEDELVRAALGSKAEVWTDDMKKRRQCPICGFNTMSSQGWLDHISIGPHAMQR